MIAREDDQTPDGSDSEKLTSVPAVSPDAVKPEPLETATDESESVRSRRSGARVPPLVVPAGSHAAADASPAGTSLETSKLGRQDTYPFAVFAVVSAILHGVLIGALILAFWFLPPDAKTDRRYEIPVEVVVGEPGVSSTLPQANEITGAASAKPVDVAQTRVPVAADDARTVDVARARAIKEWREARLSGAMRAGSTADVVELRPMAGDETRNPVGDREAKRVGDEQSRAIDDVVELRSIGKGRPHAAIDAGKASLVGAKQSHLVGDVVRVKVIEARTVTPLTEARRKARTAAEAADAVAVVAPRTTSAARAVRGSWKEASSDAAPVVATASRQVAVADIVSYSPIVSVGNAGARQPEAVDAKPLIEDGTVPIRPDAPEVASIVDDPVPMSLLRPATGVAGTGPIRAETTAAPADLILDRAVAALDRQAGAFGRTDVPSATPSTVVVAERVVTVDDTEARADLKATAVAPLPGDRLAQPSQDSSAVVDHGTPIAAVDPRATGVEAITGATQPRRTVDQQAAIQLILEGALLPPVPNKPFEQ